MGIYHNNDDRLSVLGEFNNGEMCQCLPTSMFKLAMIDFSLNISALVRKTRSLPSEFLSVKRKQKISNVVSGEEVRF